MTHETDHSLLVDLTVDAGHYEKDNVCVELIAS